MKYIQKVIPEAVTPVGYYYYNVEVNKKPTPERSKA